MLNDKLALSGNRQQFFNDERGNFNGALTLGCLGIFSDDPLIVVPLENSAPDADRILFLVNIRNLQATDFRPAHPAAGSQQNSSTQPDAPHLIDSDRYFATVALNCLFLSSSADSLSRGIPFSPFLPQTVRQS